jgi:sarcosine oxidase subunit beta
VNTGCAATRIVLDGHQISAVETTKGSIETPTVVCAAGVWAPELARTAGLELPVVPYLREVGFTGPAPDLPERVPMTIDFTTGFYFHREGPGLLFGMADRDQQPGLDAPTDPDWLVSVLEVAERRCPALVELGIAGGWKGAYEVTPDHNALVGEWSGVDRLLYATGFSGHGFLQGPAVGEIMRDLVLGREPFVDVTPLAVERFAAEAPRPERNVI